MFSEVQLLARIFLLEKNLDQNELVTQRCIAAEVLRRLLELQAREDLGYFITVTRLKSISKGQPFGKYGHLLFLVKFTCRTFMPFTGEILEGVVYRVSWHGAYMSCGPVKVVYLHHTKMPGYHFFDGETPFFQNSELSKIKAGVKVQFVVLAVRWIENHYRRKELQMLGSLVGDNLGPISTCEL